MKEVVQQRIPMLSQLVNGLAVCGLLESIRANPMQMKDLFCIDSAGCLLDNDMFVELTEAQFSQQQQKKSKEIDTHKYFCDFVDKLFHQGNVTFMVLPTKNTLLCTLMISFSIFAIRY